MAIQHFHSLAALAQQFDGLVFRDIGDDSLLVNDTVHNVWHRYAWTAGRREIKYVEQMRSELPIMLQVYPDL